MLGQIFSSPILYSLSLTLLHFLWQGMLVALILKSLLFIVDKSKSRLRYALASLAMLANGILAILTFIMVYPDTNTGINSTIGPIPLTSLVNELTQQNALLTYQELLPSILAYSLPYLSLLWLATIAILASKLLIEVRNVNNLPKHSSISPSAELLIRFEQLAKQIKLSKTPKLLISLKAEVPMAIGWLKPVVLLPASMVTGLDSAQLEMLILHELAHIRRHDYFVNFVQTIIELLFFFHPCVHWIGKQMRNEREYCSDDIAVQHCGDAIAYAHTLTDTASLCARGHVHTIPTMAMAASGGDLKARVIRLVDHHCAPTNNTSKWLAAMSLLLALTLLSINQLLTMPFAQQLNNQFPWQDGNSLNNNTFQASDNVAQKKSTEENLATILTEDSIAQQLLSRDAITINEPLIPFSEPLSIATMSGPELAYDAVIIEPLSFSNATVTDDANNKDKLRVQTDIHNQKKIDLIEANKISTRLNVAKASSSLNSSNNDSTITTLKPLAIKDNSSAILTVSKVALPSVEVTKQARISKLEAELPVQKSYYKETSTFLTSNNKDLTIKEKPYQPLSYRDEINTLATKNKLYQESHAVSTLKKSLTKNPVEVISTRALSAKLLNNINPVYPSLAKRRGIEMEIKVDFTIDRNGRVKDIIFANQSKLVYFKSSIRSAIRKWRFSPATINNRKVESKMSKIFSFSLEA